jgi:hypothetical protein
MVKKNLLAFRCGYAMLLPILKRVAVIPVKANTIEDNFIRIHGNMYIPNIYRLSTGKIKWLASGGGSMRRFRGRQTVS